MDPSSFILDLFIERLGRQRGEVRSDIRRPPFDARMECPDIAAEQCAGRLLESGQVTGHVGHEAVRNLACPAPACRTLVALPLGINHSSERGRCSASLLTEPSPMPRQEGDLPCDDPESRSAGTAGRLIRRRRPRPRGDASAYLGFTPSKVEVDWRTRPGVEDEQRRVGRRGLEEPKTGGDVGDRAAGDAAVAKECDRVW